MTLNPHSKPSFYDRAVAGFTYVELLLTVAISALLMAGLMGVVNTALQSGTDVRQRNDLTQQSRFAMQRMLSHISRSNKLLLPLNDNPNTDWPEHIREQTIPPTAPIGSSTLATAVLAVTLPIDIDLDDDGIPDADDDADGLINEDLPKDNQRDFAAGIVLIDDDGDGSVDEGVNSDDDEDGSDSEDPIDGVDNDNDGSTDEDTPTDMNNDGCPGICGVDDDNNGLVDSGDIGNDDEEGDRLEDPYDPVVFYLNSGSLIERIPVPWDTNADSNIDGNDYLESTIADNVTRFRVERLPAANQISALISLTLELTDPDSGEVISLNTMVRLGGAL